MEGRAPPLCAVTSGGVTGGGEPARAVASTQRVAGTGSRSAWVSSVHERDRARRRRRCCTAESSVGGAARGAAGASVTAPGEAVAASASAAALVGALVQRRERGCGSARGAAARRGSVLRAWSRRCCRRDWALRRGGAPAGAVRRLPYGVGRCASAAADGAAGVSVTAADARHCGRLAASRWGSARAGERGDARCARGGSQRWACCCCSGRVRGALTVRGRARGGRQRAARARRHGGAPAEGLCDAAAARGDSAERDGTCWACSRRRRVEHRRERQRRQPRGRGAGE